MNKLFGASKKKEVPAEPEKPKISMEDCSNKVSKFIKQNPKRKALIYLT